MGAQLDPVGLKEVKDHLSDLTTRVNFTGKPLTIAKDGNPWVEVRPVDSEPERQRDRLARFRALTRSIEAGSYFDPPWDQSVSDKDLLAEERASRFE